jgi:hypothetical protein
MGFNITAEHRFELWCFALTTLIGIKKVVNMSGMFITFTTKMMISQINNNK